MNISIKTIAAAIALTALVAGPASAMVSQGELRSDISSVVGTGTNVTATVTDGTVTLQGYFADAGDRYRAIQAAQNSVGVDRVISHAYQSN